MKIFTLIVTAITSVANLFRYWFEKKDEKKREKKSAVAKTTSGIGKGKPFCFLSIVILLLLITGCGYVYTISTPMTFDPNDFQYLEVGQQFEVPTDGYYFSYPALEKYIRSKIAEYEMRKRGFFHKEGQ